MKFNDMEIRRNKIFPAYFSKHKLLIIFIFMINLKTIDDPTKYWLNIQNQDLRKQVVNTTVSHYVNDVFIYHFLGYVSLYPLIESKAGSQEDWEISREEFEWWGLG